MRLNKNLSRITVILINAVSIFLLCSSVQAEWVVETIDDAHVKSGNSIALDHDGNPHVSYYDDENKSLKYARWNGSTWEKQTIDTNGWYNSIAIDNNNNPVAIHLNKENWLSVLLGLNVRIHLLSCVPLCYVYRQLFEHTHLVHF